MDAVVFDWDGTLVDTLGAIYRANVKVFAGFRLPFDEALYRRHYAPNWRVMYARLGVPPERLDEANDRWHGHFDGGADVAPFPGAVDAVRRLAEAGCALGLVTAGHRDVVGPQLERTGFGTLIPVRVYGDDLPVHKPDPEPLRVVLRELGAIDAPERTAYVGDAPDDMRMARAVGAIGVGISSILGDPDELRAAGARDVAPSVAAWVDSIVAGLDRDDGPRPATRST